MWVYIHIFDLEMLFNKSIDDGKKTFQQPSQVDNTCIDDDDDYDVGDGDDNGDGGGDVGDDDDDDDDDAYDSYDIIDDHDHDDGNDVIFISQSYNYY